MSWRKTSFIEIQWKPVGENLNFFTYFVLIRGQWLLVDWWRGNWHHILSNVLFSVSWLTVKEIIWRCLTFHRIYRNASTTQTFPIHVQNVLFMAKMNTPPPPKKKKKKEKKSLLMASNGNAGFWNLMHVFSTLKHQDFAICIPHTKTFTKCNTDGYRLPGSYTS